MSPENYDMGNCTELFTQENDYYWSLQQKITEYDGESIFYQFWILIILDMQDLLGLLQRFTNLHRQSLTD